MRHSREDSREPWVIDEKSKFTLSAKTIVACISFLVLATGWGVHQSVATERHGEQIKETRDEVRELVNEIKSVREDNAKIRSQLFALDRKLDYPPNRRYPTAGD